MSSLVAVDPVRPPKLRGLPLIGSALTFLRDPVALLDRGHREHGDVFGFDLGPQPAVVLIGPDHHKTFFERTDELLSIREAYPFFYEMFGRGLYFMAEPDEYAEQRKIVLPCFKGAKMASYVEVMAKETQLLVDRLGEEGVFDATPTLGPVVMGVAARAFLGEAFRERFGLEFFETFREFSGGIEMVLPLWLPLPRFARSRRAKKRLETMILALVAERRAAPADPPDFLQTLVGATYTDGTPLPDERILQLILMLVWAGHETTAGHVAWGLADVLGHADYAARVRQQVDDVLGRGPLDWDGQKELTLLENALLETERVHPVAPLLMRLAKEPFDVGGYHVGAGTAVFVAPSVAHKLPSVFRDPDVYDPDRFGPDRAEHKTRYSLIGFGGGSHRCAGVNFAYLEMKVVLAILMRTYDLELVDRDPQPVAGSATKWPQRARVRYQRRKDVAPLPERRASTGEPAKKCPFH